ncbi:MAG: LapA family protein [Planctomycetota bacterium]
MIYNILSFWMPGPYELLVILIVSLIPVVLVIWFARFLLRNKRENVRLRLEVGKLADELEQTRKQKDDENNNSANKSG